MFFIQNNRSRNCVSKLFIKGITQKIIIFSFSFNANNWICQKHLNALIQRLALYTKCTIELVIIWTFDVSFFKSMEEQLSNIS